MHEATLAARMLDIAREAASAQTGRVRRVTVAVGELAGVMNDALTFAFDALKKDTPLRSAELAIETSPARALCLDCGEAYAPKGFPFRCPRCASDAFRLTGGEEVYVRSMEVES